MSTVCTKYFPTPPHTAICSRSDLVDTAYGLPEVPAPTLKEHTGVAEAAWGALNKLAAIAAAVAIENMHLRDFDIRAPYDLFVKTHKSQDWHVAQVYKNWGFPQPD
jgi:hypothetical protein